MTKPDRLAPGARVVVIGAGTMGHGIAQVVAASGFAVTLVDTSRELVDRGLERIRSNLQGGIDRGKLTLDVRDATLGRLTGSDNLEAAVRDAALVIEAVPERFDLKAALFDRVEAAAPAGAIIATNTSSLSVTDLQQRLAKPGRMLGLHFFNPVHIMQLIEVVRGRATDDEVVDAGVAFCGALAREPIVVNDAPGFASSRLGIALGLEAMRMVEEGVASPADIDKAMELGYRHPMGPLRLTDLVGLDVRLDIARYLHEKLGGERFRPPAILERLVAQGKLGKKTGHGFYDWDGESA
ncbi:MAG TPA: 3-hydroxyacyl-CoA dehydrogenase family protein [Longimicrobiales bacterium]|nr:3-hydroxyacyl-CoA dehydrogenase family protein [Longimicrobiales bacterium]